MRGPSFWSNSLDGDWAFLKYYGISFIEVSRANFLKQKVKEIVVKLTKTMCK